MEKYYIEKENPRFLSGPVYASLQYADAKKQIISPHIHSAIELLIIKEGVYSIYVGERHYTARVGDIVLLRSNTIHHTYNVSDGRSSYYVIKVRPSLLAELSAESNDSKLLLFFALDRDTNKCFWKAHEVENTPLGNAISHFTDEFESKAFAHTVGETIAVSSILLEILREGNRCGLDEPVSRYESITQRIYSVLLYINENYNMPITAVDCSDIAGMSYSYFSRTFKTIVGKSFKEYLNFTRINHAKKALLSTDMTVTETAAHCGFDNVSYFISVYKRMTGNTPRNTKKL